jgi:hypothetical protein
LYAGQNGAKGIEKVSMKDMKRFMDGQEDRTGGRGRENGPEEETARGEAV